MTLLLPIIDFSIPGRHFNSIAVLLLILIHTRLSGQESNRIIQSSYQKPFEHVIYTGVVKGRVTDSRTNSPVCYADIYCNNKTRFTKSNSKGEFVLLPPEFPVSLRIRKFGYKEETIIVNSPEDSILISIIPLEIHKKYSGYKVTLEYASLLLTKAIEKLRINAAGAHPDRSQREHVYCRITSSADSTMNSLFESYSQMNVNEYSLQGYQSDVARFASTINSIPGITGNMLEFKIEPFIRLPFFAERFINRKGFFEQDGNRTELTLLLT